MSHHVEQFRRAMAVEVLTLEQAIDAIARSLARLRMGFEELSDMAPTPLPPSLDLDEQVT
jgi:hypothetical protein